ncbi:MAG: sulfatase-like hydrolase/transferase [Dehalococcoidia bacterium]|jgi:arylsulfatase A|nr:sulfatase-like hydrolase/transferase [Dehalococcoidia bacterium]
MSVPNIVLIVADDMGYGDFGRFNNGHVRTPVLDGLVDECVSLTQHYSGSPVCAPARAALMTGRYPHRTGAITPQETLGYDRLGLDEVTLADALKTAGYATGLVGKWHLGALDPRFHPNARGFDEFAGFRGGWADYYRWRLDRNGSFEESDGRYLTDVLAEEAVDFIRRHATEPFFLNVTFNTPHSPLQAPEDLVAPYREMGLSEGVALTYAMIEVMDRGVGRILGSIDDAGIAANTIVQFTSDNGPAFMLRPDQVPDSVSIDTTRYNCGFNGAKGSVYEGGIRVPMLARWPDGLDGGREVRDILHFTDWVPTLLGIAGVERPDGPPLDGHDVLPALRGEPVASPPRFWQWNNYSPIPATNAAMRDGDWKLVRPDIDGIVAASSRDQELMEMYVQRDIDYKYRPSEVTKIADWPEPERIIPDPPIPELYNIAADPLERNNLTGSDPGRARRMLAELETWFESVESDRLRARQER